MTEARRLRNEARLLTTEVRKEIIAAIPETDLHDLLAELFRAMNPDFWVDVTHGTTEFGKDLVVVRADPLLMDVAGVVVKRGDIRAKTSGDVDAVIREMTGVLTAKGESITEEIVSQVRQAKVHSAELSARVRDLKCNRVITILAGEMSSHARKRIQQEIGTSPDVHDLTWLVDSFTDFYPQVFFEARAVDYLYDAIASMEADSFHSRSGKTLTECFVEPVIAPMDKDLSLDDASHIVKVRQNRIRFSQLGSMLTQKRRILLIGDPGSGKTKAVAKFCIDGYRSAVNQMTKRERSTDPVGIPITVAARRFALYQEPDELLDALLPLKVRNRLKAATLVLDGLDEVPSDQRDPTLRKAEQFATFLGTALLVTSRRLAAFAAAPKGFSRFEILPFEIGQAMRLVRKVLVSSDVLPVLKHGIETIHSQLPMNPLSLILLIEVVAELKEVPASLTELYERFLDLVFGRWDQDKGITVLFEYVVKKRFLATLAFEEFYSKGRLDIPAPEFERFLNKYADEFGWDSDQLSAFAKEIDRAGVLDTTDDVFFRHRSFADFFVGLYLHENRDALDDMKERVVTTYFDPIWMEAAFFYVGLIRRITPQYLNAMFAHEEAGVDFSVEKLMIGRLLQAGWYSAAATKENGIRATLDYLEGTAAMARAFMKAAKRPMPDFFAELYTLALAQHSLGSFAVQSEGSKVLRELSISADRTPAVLLKRAALLWALRHHLTVDEHADAIRSFVTAIGEAKLGPVDEAKFLAIAGLADPASDVRKIIGRRMRRIEADKPAAIAALLPGKRPAFQPPKSVR